jgi:mono/diheme cytochrome c family protein
MATTNSRRRIRVQWIVLLMLIALALVWGALSRQAPSQFEAAVADKDDAGARAAFLEAYKVFMHARCLNCHPVGDVPLQGDDSRPHFMNVQRGSDGKGLYALKCANCHQDANLPGANMPPGNPNWHLTPPEMPMVFEGKSPRELARQLKDPKQNGGKTLEQIIHHVTEDKLVLWGWEPGDGRTRPPLTHAQFAKKMQEWAAKGAAEPE